MEHSYDHLCKHLPECTQEWTGDYLMVRFYNFTGFDGRSKVLNCSTKFYCARGHILCILFNSNFRHYIYNFRASCNVRKRTRHFANTLVVLELPWLTIHTVCRVCLLPVHMYFLYICTSRYLLNPYCILSCSGYCTISLTHLGVAWALWMALKGMQSHF